MRLDYPIVEEDIEYWTEELNRLIPEEVDGVTPEGSEEIRSYEYIEGSVRIDRVLDDEVFYRSHLCFLQISYLIKIDEIRNYTFQSKNQFACVEVPVFLTGAMDLSEVSFLDGLVQYNYAC